MNRGSPSHEPGNSPANLDLLVFALCTLLGATTSAVAGATVGIALLLVFTLSLLLFVSIRSFLATALQAAAFVVIFSSGVTVVDLLLRAWWPDLHREAGFFLPLAIGAGPLLATTDMLSPAWTRAAILGRTAMGCVFALAATLAGGLRELAGSAPGEHGGFLLALLPPGALIAVGILLAARNALANRGGP